MGKSFIIRLLENFLCAGSTALLIPIAYLDPALWFISLLALVPFLWRCTRVSLLESVALAGVLATSYGFVTGPVASWAAPGAFVFKLLRLSLLFVILGVAANRLSKQIALRFILLTISWLPLQYALSRCAYLGSILALSETDPTLLIRIGSLSGALLISLAIVVINWLLVVLLEHAIRVLFSGGTFFIESCRRQYLSFKVIVLEKRWDYLPEPRGPPLGLQLPA